MRAGRDTTMTGRVLAALLLSVLLLIGGASAAGADGYGSDGGHGGYGSTYPTPEGPPATPTESDSPPVLARTGSDSGMLVAGAVGALVVGGGLVVLAKRRRGALTPA